MAGLLRLAGIYCKVEASCAGVTLAGRPIALRCKSIARSRRANVAPVPGAPQRFSSPLKLLTANKCMNPALSKERKSPPWAHRALTKETQIPWGSCALAWAVKEVPDSEAGPPDAELPRQTEVDPLPKEKRERPVRARSLRQYSDRHVSELHSSPIRRVGSMVDPPSTRNPAKRLRDGS